MYGQITEFLTDTIKKSSVCAAFERAVEAEGKALEEYAVGMNKARRTVKLRRNSLDLAREYYAVDISDLYKTMLDYDQTYPCPDSILCNRRYATAWAVARLMYIDDKTGQVHP